MNCLRAADTNISGEICKAVRLEAWDSNTSTRVTKSGGKGRARIMLHGSSDSDNGTGRVQSGCPWLQWLKLTADECTALPYCQLTCIYDLLFLLWWRRRGVCEKRYPSNPSFISIKVFQTFQESDQAKLQRLKCFS